MAYRPRKVQNLTRAELLPNKPPAIPVKGQRFSIKQKMGLKYEKQVQRLFATAGAQGDSNPAPLYGPWIRYEDGGGTFYAQPDIVIPHKTFTLIVECKLSFRQRRAYIQLNDLYRPLLQWLYPEVPVRLLQVCQFLKPNIDCKLITNVNDALKSKVDWTYATLHYRP